ncbi:hypothetical protein [Sphingomonas sp. PAMC 26621]|uniref:hypothetical protein n=1 Tax=Sphingomonas sp. PAMC 26621 TaxID=1112213 RepID=UPI0002891883|nr:hypothetical protein [Sphingomonas sp. PAMC 26621]
MRRHIAPLSLVLSLALLPAAASAQTPTADPDVRCLLVSNVFAEKEPDAKKKQVAILTVTYYLGRVDAKLSPEKFRSAVVAVGKEPLGKDIATTMTNCARALQTKQVATAEMMQGIAKSQAAAAAATPAKGR